MRLSYIFIAVSLLIGVDRAAAADVYTPVKSALTDQKSGAERVEPYFGIDVAPGWFFGHSGATFAPYGNLDTSGFRVWVFGEAGTYRYFPDPASSQKIRGTEEAGELMFGYGFVGENYEFSLFAGANVENDNLSEPDPENPVQGTKFGAKVRADLWMNPTPRTLVAGEAEYSTAFKTYHTKGKLGYDLFGTGMFIGPEVVAMGDERYDQWRVGAHLTALRFGKVNMDLSAGYVHTSDFTAGAYTTVELNFRF